MWNKSKQLQSVTGYTAYSPLWGNHTYAKLAKIQQRNRWHAWGITLVSQVFQHGKLMSFVGLQCKFALPDYMFYYYLQLSHAVKAQGNATDWSLTPTPIFHLLQSATKTKGFISPCYHMLLMEYLSAYHTRAMSQWEEDVGTWTGDQWEEAFQSANMCSLNVSQKVSQLYILLRVHYTPVKLHKMGRLQNPLCSRCRRTVGDLIYNLWRCPKVHHYWSLVLSTLNSVFQVNVPLNPIHCLLETLEEVIPNEATTVAFSRALFQARKVILLVWKSLTPLSVKTWVT